MKESFLELSVEQAIQEIGLVREGEAYTISGTVLRVLADSLEVKYTPLPGVASELTVKTATFLDLSVAGKWYRFSAEAGQLKIQLVSAE